MYIYIYSDEEEILLVASGSSIATDIYKVFQRPYYLSFYLYICLNLHISIPIYPYLSFLIYMYVYKICIYIYR